LLPPGGLPGAPIEAPFAVEDLAGDLAVVATATLLFAFDVEITATDDEADLPVEPLALDLEVPNPTADTPDDDPLLDLAPPVP
jgi:hypothetical protein